MKSGEKEQKEQKTKTKTKGTEIRTRKEKVKTDQLESRMTKLVPQNLVSHDVANSQDRNSEAMVLCGQSHLTNRVALSSHVYLPKKSCFNSL